MTEGKSKTVVMPLRVFVGPGTKAEKAFHARKSMPRPEAIAPGIPPTPAHDLIFHGGHTIADLVFTNFYVGGTAAWKASDIENIDKALAAAMSDVDLNNVMSQYYPSGKITSTFRPSQTLAGAATQSVFPGRRRKPGPATLCGGDVEWLRLRVDRLQLHVAQRNDSEYGRGADGRRGSGRCGKGQDVRKRVPVEEEEDSTQGLGGYHGSVHVESGASSTKVLYYAVGVFSENSAGWNGERHSGLRSIVEERGRDFLPRTERSAHGSGCGRCDPRGE